MRSSPSASAAARVASDRGQVAQAHVGPDAARLAEMNEVGRQSVAEVDRRAHRRRGGQPTSFGQARGRLQVAPDQRFEIAGGGMIEERETCGRGAEVAGHAQHVARSRARAAQATLALDFSDQSQIEDERARGRGEVPTGERRAGRRESRGHAAGHRGTPASASSGGSTRDRRAWRARPPIAAMSLRLTAAKRAPSSSGSPVGAPEVTSFDEGVAGQQDQALGSEVDDRAVIARTDDEIGAVRRQERADPLDQLEFSRCCGVASRRRPTLCASAIARAHHARSRSTPSAKSPWTDPRAHRAFSGCAGDGHHLEQVRDDDAGVGRSGNGREDRDAVGSCRDHLRGDFRSDAADAQDRKLRLGAEPTNAREPHGFSGVGLRRSRLVHRADAEIVGPLALGLARLADRATETPITAPAGRRARAAATGASSCPRWTPSAPASSATSTRSLTRNSAPCARARSPTRRATTTKSASPSVLSRNWRKFAPLASTARASAS